MVGISEGWVVTHDGRVDLMDPGGSGGGMELDRFFIDCVKDDRPITAPAADLDEAVKTMELAEAIPGGAAGVVGGVTAHTGSPSWVICRPGLFASWRGMQPVNWFPFRCSNPD